MKTLFLKYYIVFFNFLFISIFFSCLVFASEVSERLIFNIILCLPIYYISFLKPLRNFKKNNFYLIDFFKLTLFFFIIVKFLLYILTERSGVVYYDFYSINLSNVTFTLLIVWLSFISLDFSTFFLKSTHKTQNKIFVIQNTSLPMLLLVFFTIFKIVLLLSGVSGYGSSTSFTFGFYSLIKSISDVIFPMALIIVTYITLSPNHFIKNNYILLFYTILSVNILLGIISGMKEEVLTPIIIYILLFYYFGNRISMIVILFSSFLILLLYPIINNYRTYLNDFRMVNNSKIELFDLSLNNILENQNFTYLIADGYTNYTNRTDLFGQLNDAINKISNWNSYKYMDRYLTLPFFPFVPRVAWTNKPRNDLGSEFYHMQSGYYDNESNSVTVSTIGWAYLEGGAFFVIVIFFLLGICFNYIDSKKRHSFKYLILWIIAFFLAIKPEWDPFFAIAKLFQTFIFLTIFLKILKVKIYATNL